MLILSSIVEDVIDEVSNKILARLQWNIMKYTYMFDYFPNKIYFDNTGNPTFEFLHAWVRDDIRKAGKSLTRQIFYDYSNMKFDPKKYLHGSPSRGDEREKLAEILNVSGKPGEWEAKERAPYWKITIEELFGGGLITQMFDDAFRKRGIIRI